MGRDDWWRTLTAAGLVFTLGGEVIFPDEEHDAAHVHQETPNQIGLCRWIMVSPVSPGSGA